MGAGGSASTQGEVTIRRAEETPQKGGSNHSSACSTPRGSQGPGLARTSSLRELAQPPSCPNGHTADLTVQGQWEVQASLSAPWRKFDTQAQQRLEKAFHAYVDSNSETPLGGGEGGNKTAPVECSIVISGKMHSVCLKRLIKKGPGDKGNREAVRRVDKGQADLDAAFNDPFQTREGEETPKTSGFAIPEHEGGHGRRGTATLNCTIDAHQNSIYTISVSANGDQVLTGCKDGSVKLFELDTGFVVREFDKPDDETQIITVALSKTKPLLATGSDDFRVRLFNPAQSAPVAVLEGHEHKVYATLFTTDSRNLLTASMDGSLRLWDLTSHRLTKTVIPHATSVFAASTGPQNSWLALAASDDNTCTVHDLRLPDDKTTTATLKGHTKTLWGCDIRYDEAEYATCGMDGTVHLWDSRKMDFPTLKAKVTNHGGAIHWVEYMPEGGAILSSSRDKSWRMTNTTLSASAAATGGTPLMEEIIRQEAAHRGNVFRVTYNPTKNRVVTCSSDKTVKVWDLDLTGSKRSE